jgi:lipopolysaccharide transport system ATP-binding protein
VAPVISVRELSKDFPLRSRRRSPVGFREALGLRRPGKPREERFLALKNVSFDVNEGDIVGILGRNGAGKSTLLKILARITPPSAGRVELSGSVGTLLEAGTGFHGELTGRENINLNAAILGMTAVEVRSKFDAIVDFAGIEPFLDTPVKRYSTGMYMRLAFSVAAHMETDILLVDEVLSLGDVAFQKKCLARIEDVSRGGRTVLFVSHDIQTVTRLCQRAILLDAGILLREGPTHDLVNTYAATSQCRIGGMEWPESQAPGDDCARLRRVRLVSCANETKSAVETSEPFGIEVVFDVLVDGLAPFPVIRLYNEWGTEVVWTTDSSSPSHGDPRPVGQYQATAQFPANFLAEGTLTVSASLCSIEPEVTHFQEPDAVQFQVLDSLGERGSRGQFTGYIGGLVRPLLRWSEKFEESY